MRCLKCGKEIGESLTFCESCLDSMSQYPVKPGTVIHLPRTQPEAPAKKSASRRRTPTLEEQLSHLKKLLHWLVALLCIMSVLLGIAIGMLLHSDDAPMPEKVVGRNYTITTQR